MWFSVEGNGMNKTEVALERIKKAALPIDLGSIFAGHSGGKDSCVIHHLAKRALGDSITTVHNVKPMLGTSGDPVAALTEMHPETLEFLYSNVCKKGRVLFMHSSNMPEWVKENSMRMQIDGARIAEANRPGKSSDIIRNGVNVNRSLMTEIEPVGIFGLTICYPILDWSDEDVFDYLNDNDLPFSAEYLKNGEYDSWKWKKTHA
jgi:3'-phosphoadenosine 5'-phosphosulfate sulfotransferase (PAPS reductase)/FAD synthetase